MKRSYLQHKPTHKGFHRLTIEEARDGLRARRGQKPARFGRARLKAKPDRALAKWSREVRERDDYACRWPDCFYRSPSIHAHHILTKAQRPDLRLVVENGAAVCPEHHDHLHHTVEGRRRAREIGLLGTETYELAQREKRAA